MKYPKYKLNDGKIDKALWLGILGYVLAVGAVLGLVGYLLYAYFGNAYKCVTSDFKAPYKREIIRCAAIIPPISFITPVTILMEFEEDPAAAYR